MGNEPSSRRSFRSEPTLSHTHTRNNTTNRKTTSSATSPSPTRLNRQRLSNQGMDDWGNFVDCDERQDNMPWDEHDEYSPRPPERRALSLPNPVTAPPMYVLESSLETQQLWYATAGQRPRQPDHERRYFERLWLKNFQESAVKYPPSLLTPEGVSGASSASATASSSGATDTSGSSREQHPQVSAIAAALGRGSASHPNPGQYITAPGVDKIPLHEFNCTVLYRGRGPFSKSVSKSFVANDCTMVTLQLPRYRVVEDRTGHVYAEYLIVVSLGSTGSITLGIWKRHSDFLALANQLIEMNGRKGHESEFKNTILSWQCVLQRKQWVRCLDKEYLSLKCFLLERFMHDFIFESSTPDILHDFLGLD